jgi:hypothetical protein
LVYTLKHIIAVFLHKTDLVIISEKASNVLIFRKEKNILDIMEEI